MQINNRDRANTSVIIEITEVNKEQGPLDTSTTVKEATVEVNGGAPPTSSITGSAREKMEVNKDQDNLDTSMTTVKETTVEVNEGARASSSINGTDRDKMEVKKDEGTSHTSITVKEATVEVNEGATATSSINDNERENMEINKDQGTLNTSITVQETVEGNQEAGATSNTNDSVSTGFDSKHIIFKVHNLLRNVNSKAYEPEIIGIGPYHRNKSHLQLMETHKLRFQALMLQRREEDLSIYLEAIKPLEEKARKSYAESTAHIPPDEFVKMLVLDGIFIIEFLCKSNKLSSTMEKGGPVDAEVNNIRNDPLFRMPWALILLKRDLMLFENQLPFFILAKLYGMIEPGRELKYFNNVAVYYFSDLCPGIGDVRKSSDTTTGVVVPQDDQCMNIKHLLDLIHMYWGSQKVTENVRSEVDTLDFIGCSTNLREAGIKFQNIEGEVCFDIEFKNGVLRIPVLSIDENTDSFLRNLIAFEQYCGDTRFHIVTDYMTFFSCLIKTKEDVARLTQHGILRSFVMDEEVVSKMFKTIIESTTGPSETFHYAEIFRSVKKHCGKRKNKYMAILRRKYMNSPWGIISTLTVTALLFLAILEVAFQILSWQSQILSGQSQIKDTH